VSAARAVGVVGAGSMGVGIAHAFTTTGSAVVIVEPDPHQRERAFERISDVIDNGVQRGRLAAEEGDAARRRLRLVEDVTELPERLDLIVEAVPEIPELKRRVLAAAEGRMPRLLASNTSSISIDELATALDRPAAFLGLHFFNPVWSMKLVEIVVGGATSDAAVEHARGLVSALGKEPISVRDAPGFASSRLGVLLGLEAVRMVEEGIAAPADIDKAMELGYGHPMGPLRLTDLVGLDVRLDIARVLAVAYGERFQAPRLLEEMVAAGKLGKKSGEGFYQWVAQDGSG
jgi:3-hydroxybutyryl-CoA dehydrogenase